ncbi:small subunit ribosomal protein S29e [Pancytospora philotis]|nr:small subunit ribosomal protein S29e [Pancytospora philotis]
MAHDLVIRMDIDKEASFTQMHNQGKGARKCRRCANHRGFNSKHGLNLCRRCLRDKAADIGLVSFD